MLIFKKQMTILIINKLMINDKESNGFVNNKEANDYINIKETNDFVKNMII